VNSAHLPSQRKLTLAYANEHLACAVADVFADRVLLFRQFLRKAEFIAAIVKDDGAFQHKEFFALCPSENSWQIDAMNANRKCRSL
jgi:hypothetical protein